MFVEKALPGGAVLWHANSASGGLVSADGCVDLIWAEDEVLLSGPSTKAIDTKGVEGDVWGLRIPPGLASLVINFPVSQTRDLLVDASNLWSRAELHSFTVAAQSEEDIADLWCRGYHDVDKERRGFAAEVTRLAADRVSAESAASHMGYSPRHLRRLVKNQFGYGYQSLIGLARSRQAQGLMTSSCLSLAEIAHLCGYSDQSHMSREIRKLTGYAPSALAALTDP